LASSAAALGVHGSLDPAFGKDGKVETAVANSRGGIAAVVIQPDGKIIAGGDGKLPLVRYRADGKLDPTFGTRGGVAWPRGGVRAMVLQPDGKLVTAGDGARRLRFSHFALHRFLANGKLDRTFGIAGAAVLRNGGV